MGSAMTMPQGIKSLTPDDLADFLHAAEIDEMHVANQVNKRLSPEAQDELFALSLHNGEQVLDLAACLVRAKGNPKTSYPDNLRRAVAHFGIELPARP